MYSVPKLLNAGLGNDLVPICKAYLASQVLNAKLLLPLSFDRTRMKSYFNPLSMKIPPDYTYFNKKVTFGRHDYWRVKEITGTFDYYENVKYFAQEKNLPRNVTLVSEGMWGGFRSIARSKNWVKSFLLHNDISRKNVAEISTSLDPLKFTVAVHVRRGDFNSSNNSSRTNREQSVFNTRIPLEWYINVVKDIKNTFGEHVQFILFSDGSEKELDGLIKICDPTTTKHQKNNHFSDLLLMSEADLLVCSLSSYSMWGAFLSGKPYLLYKPYVAEDHNGQNFLWEEYVSLNTPTSSENYRGFISDESGLLPYKLSETIQQSLLVKKSWDSELIMGGRIN